MKLSLCLDPGRSWAEVLALAQRVDAAGWHSVYVCDHFMPHDEAGRAADGPMLECWSVLAAVAARTDHVGVGSLVLGNTYRHPAVVAAMAATADQISSGRLVLGIGAGWQPNEHGAYGIPLSPPAERIAALDQACAVIRSVLDRRRSAIGDQASNVRLLIGGSGRQTMRQDVCGAPEEVLSQLLAYRDAGADEFIVRDDAANVSARHALAQIDVVTETVLPGLSR